VDTQSIPAPFFLDFTQMPACLPAYVKILFSRKPPLVEDGASVPLMEAKLAEVAFDPVHLARYRAVCGFSDPAIVPITYPHVAAMPLHLAIMACDAFPVRPLGIVHLRNRIAQKRPLAVGEPVTMRAWIEGHRDVERGQELDMYTELRAGGEVVWLETCTLFVKGARRRKPGAARTKPSGEVERPRPPPVTTATSFEAQGDIGRRYARVSRDFNPIHLTTMLAKAFGFDRAVAHGMWSLARCAAALDGAVLSKPCELNVSFRLPVRLPTGLRLHTWHTDTGQQFVLRDALDTGSHLWGALRIQQ
jgi:acyl dehydratase